MLDFKDSRVFESEGARYRRFLNEKLSTLEEEESRAEMLDDDNGDMLLDTSTFIGSEDSFDFGSMDDSDFGSDFSSSERSDISNDQSHVLDSKWKTILASPYFLVIYVSKLLIYDFPKKEEWKNVFKMLNKITMFSAIGSLAFWLIDFKFIFSLPFQALTSTLMFISSKLALKFFFKEDNNSESDNPFGEMGDFGEGDEFSGFEEGDVGGFGSGLNFDTDDLSNVGSVNSFDSMFDSEEEGIDTFSGYELDKSKDGILAPSPIDVSTDAKFDKTLLDVYKKNVSNQGVVVNDRKELVESLSDYIISNDRTFGTWDTVKQGSVEYNNISFALFKGLGQMMNSFLTDEERLIVLGITCNPLLYRIEVELPSYFKRDMVQRRLKEIEDAIKESDEDTQVEVYMSFFRGKFVFKFVRPSRKMISLGDILRFYDEDKKQTPLELFDDPSVGLPILFGLRQMEYPYFVDLEDNTSGVIVGGSGSGKSWLTFLMMINFVLTNDYNNLNFVILDLKGANFWNQFAKFPHVLGYHYEIEDYLEILRELYAEVDRRKELLREVGAENYKGLRKDLRKSGDYEKLKEFPLLVIIIDESTSTMSNLRTMYEDEKERYDEAKAIISQITQEGRSLGVRILLIGQRAIDSSIPRNALANSSFKFGMKMNVEGDFNTMFGKEVDPIPKPDSMGMALSSTEGVSGIHPVKTVTIGGANDSQMGKFIRVLALEWVRRSIGVDDLYNQPNGMELDIAYNRDKFLRESLEDIREGRILLPSTVNEGYKEHEISNGNVRKSITENKVKSDDELLSALKDSFNNDDESYEESEFNSTSTGLDDILDEYTDDLDEPDVEQMDIDEEEDFDIDSLINEIFKEKQEEPNVTNQIGEEMSLDDMGIGEEDLMKDEMLDDDMFEGLPSMEDDLPTLGEGLPVIDNELTVDLEEVTPLTEEPSIYVDTSIIEEPKPVQEPVVVPKVEPVRTSTPKPKPVEKVNLPNTTQFKDNFTDEEKELGLDKDDWEIENEILANTTIPRPKPQPKKRPVKRKVVVRKVRQRKPVSQSQPYTGVQLDFNNQATKTTGNFAPDMSIREYILQKGKPDGITTYKIEKEKLIVIYGEQRVLEEIQMLTIIEDGDFFVTQI